MGLSDLAPSGAVVVTGRLDDPRWVADAAPADVALASGHTAVRRRELLAGRGCARLALARLGRALDPDETVGRLPDRGPSWPPGVVGSLVHGGGEVAAVVAHASLLDGLGVDVEAAGPMSDGVVGLVATDDELRSAARCGLGAVGAMVVFSVKEAAYKAWAPRGGWLEHDEVGVELRRDGSAGVDVTTRTGSRAVLESRWEVDGGVVRCVAWRGVAQ